MMKCYHMIMNDVCSSLDRVNMSDSVYVLYFHIYSLI